MKYVSLYSILIIACFLFTSCSPKETFYFSKITGSFGPNQKVQKGNNLRNKLIFPNKLTNLDLSNNTDSLVLTATTSAATNMVLLPLPKQTLVRGFKGSIVAKKIVMHPYPQVKKNIARQNHAIKKNSDEPVAIKKIQLAALAGFIFSLAALISIFATSAFVSIFATTWPLGVLLGFIGSILGIVGLIKIKLNPDKYSGEGLAWIGIIVGLIISLFIVGFALAYAGVIQFIIIAMVYLWKNRKLT